MARLHHDSLDDDYQPLDQSTPEFNITSIRHSPVTYRFSGYYVQHIEMRSSAATVDA
jgi:hypothetical protein